MVSERSPAPGTVGLSHVRFCCLQHQCLSLRPSSGWCVNENSCKCVKNPTGLSVPLHVFCWFPPIDHNATSIRLPPQPQPDCQSCCVEMTGWEVNIHLFMLPPSTVQPLSSAVIFPATFYPFSLLMDNAEELIEGTGVFLSPFKYPDNVISNKMSKGSTLWSWLLCYLLWFMCFFYNHVPLWSSYKHLWSKRKIVFFWYLLHNMYVNVRRSHNQWT